MSTAYSPARSTKEPFQVTRMTAWVRSSHAAAIAALEGYSTVERTAGEPQSRPARYSERRPCGSGSSGLAAESGAMNSVAARRARNARWLTIVTRSDVSVAQALSRLTTLSAVARHTDQDKLRASGLRRNAITVVKTVSLKRTTRCGV